MKKLLLASALAILLATPVRAAEQDMTLGNAYVGLGGSLVIPSNRSITATGVLPGSGNIHYKDGEAISLMAGYHFTDFLAGEATLGYAGYDYSNISGTLGGVPGTVNANGHDHMTVGLLNALVTPFHANHITPYFGGGFGFVSAKSALNSISAGGVTVPVNSSSSKTSLAWDGLLGLDVSLTNHFSLGGRYQYIWASNSDSATSSGETIKVGDSSASVFTLQATYKF